MEWKGGRKMHRHKMLTYFYLSMFFFICVLFGSNLTAKTRCLEVWSARFGEEDLRNFDQKSEKFTEGMFSAGKKEISFSMARRSLGGPGSWPPRCASKCGKCTPCEPVHVPVPPGTRLTAEYYPEAWRCKCGNRLYIP